METGQCGPDKSVDGDPNSRFCGHPPDQAVLGFDLGASRRISKMRIRFERAFAREYEIDVGLMGDYNETETKPKGSVWSNEDIESLNIQVRHTFFVSSLLSKTVANGSASHRREGRVDRACL